MNVGAYFQSDMVSRICFALVHLIGMSSAFSNPILYGWFNEAFRTEFQNIARQDHISQYPFKVKHCRELIEIGRMS